MKATLAMSMQEHRPLVAEVLVEFLEIRIARNFGRHL